MSDTFQKIVEKVVSSSDIEKDLLKKVREVVSRITVDEIEALVKPLILSKIEIELNNLLTDESLWEEISDKVEESIMLMIKPMLSNTMHEFSNSLSFSFKPKRDKEPVKDTAIPDKLSEMKVDKLRKLILSNKLVTTPLPKTKDELIRILLSSNPLIAKNGRITFIKK